LVEDKGSVRDAEVKRFRTTKDPLKILVGKKPYRRHVPVDELEEKLESR